MPKNRKIVRDESSNIVRVIAPSKFRVGNRQSTITAHQTSTKELLSFIKKKANKKYKNKILTVLSKRLSKR